MHKCMCACTHVNKCGATPNTDFLFASRSGDSLSITVDGVVLCPGYSGDTLADSEALGIPRLGRDG